MPKLTPSDRAATQGIFGVTREQTRSERRPLVADTGPGFATDEQIARQIAVSDEIGWTDSFTAGFMVYNSAGRWLGNQGDPDFPFDLDYSPEVSLEYTARPEIKARVAALGGDAEDVGSYLGNSVSVDHLEFLLGKLEQERDYERIAGEHMTAMLASAVIDPIDFAVTGASAGLGLLSKAAKLKRMIAFGLTAGVSNGLIESYIASESPFVGAKRVAFATALGLVIGGGLGSLGRNVDIAIKNAAEEIAKDAAPVVRVASGRDEIARAKADQVGGESGGAARRIIDADEDVKLPLAAEENVQGVTRPIDERDFRFEAVEKFQRSLIGRTFFSDNKMVQDLAVRFMEGGHLARGKVREFTANLRAEALDRKFMTVMYRDTKNDFNAWAKINGYGIVGTNYGTEAGRVFFTDITRALRGGVPESPHAAAAAKKIRPLLNTYWYDAQRVGVKGFEGDPLPNYVPRMYSFDKWATIVDELGGDDIGRARLAGFFKENLLNSTDLTPKLADAISKGMVRSTMRRQAGMDQQMVHGIPLHDMDELRKFLNPADDPIDAKLANEIVEQLEEFNAARAAADPDKGNIRFAQKRIQFDELYEVDVRLGNGGTRKLTIADLTENDGRKLLTRYSRIMSGHIGMAQEAGILSRADFEARMQMILEDGINKNRLAKAEGEVEALTIAYKSITGQSLERDPFGTFAQVSRAGMIFTYLLNGGMFGLAQIPELGNAIGEAGIRTFLHYVPQFATILKIAKNGQLNSKIGRDLELMSGAGTDFLRNPAMASFEDAAGTITHQGWLQKALQKMDPALKSAGKAMTSLNMMAPINAAMQRMSALMTNVKYAGIATGRRKANAGDIARLRANGISESMEKRIYAAMRESSEWEKGKLVGYDVKKWEDLDSGSLDAWNMHNVRSFRQAIQENDIGNQAGIWSSTTGRMMAQFRTFTFQSVNKQLMFGINQFDVQQFTSWSTAMFLASIVYIARTGIEFADSPDELKKRLTNAEIAKAAFSRSGFGSIAPTVVDSALGLMGMEPVFQHMRTSGLATDFLTGNPIVSLADSAYNTVGLPYKVMQDDYEFSQADARKLVRQLPYSNLLGVRNALAIPFKGLPETSKD